MIRQAVIGLTGISVLASPAFAFTLISFDGKPARWKDTDITYTILPHSSKDFDVKGCDSAGECVSERKAIAAAFASWSSVDGVDLKFEERVVKSWSDIEKGQQNAIVWVESNWGQLSFSPPPGALAVTMTSYRTSDNSIVNSNIYFNGQYFTWGNIDTKEELNSGRIVDVQNIATHEVGHFLGLDHSSEKFDEPNDKYYLATMFYASGAGEIHRRKLSADDHAAIKHLYGTSDVPAPSVSEISETEIDTRINSSVKLTIHGENFSEMTAVTLVTGKGREDISATVDDVTEVQLDVTFDLYGLETGTFDLLVANSFGNQELLKDAIEIVSNYSSYSAQETGNTRYSSATGCSSSSSDQSFYWVLLIFVGYALLGRRSQTQKAKPVYVRSKQRRLRH